jgi:transcriptional antiterminator RfaH
VNAPVLGSHFLSKEQWRACNFMISGEPTPRWYLIHSKPLAERSAQANLERQGYFTYLPQVRHPAPCRQQPEQRVAALFPRYLFLRLAVGRQSLQPIHSTIGVANIVRFGMRCAIVRDEVIEELRSRADPVTGLHTLRPVARFVRGTRVRITAGPFCGIDGIFERAEGAERVTILLTLLGEERPLQFPTELIEHAAC